MTFQLYQTRLEPHYKNITVSENVNNSYLNQSSLNYTSKTKKNLNKKLNN